MAASDLPELCRFLDHAVLGPELTVAEAAAGIELGPKFNVRTVCVRPMDIALARTICRGSQTQVGTVLAFPHGTALGASKADEARRYLDLGADEIDMVANYSLIRSERWDLVEADVRAVRELTGPAGRVLKVILETAALSAGQIARATQLCAGVGAQFVKTSTGFGPGGATEQAVSVMVRAAEGKIQVKASGGIRDAASARRFLELGATRLGVGFKTTPLLCSSQQ